jgi:sialic acid synthase SpsE
MKEFRLGDRLIGDEHPPFVIAEVGINHEGSFEKAMALVDAAIGAHADCVKFQCHITEAEMIPTDMKPGKISEERLWDIIKRCELTEAEEISIKRYCDQQGILYLSTPFSREASDRLEAMGVLGFKIGSGEANNLPLVEHIARKGKPIILSTGMNDLNSIRPSVEVITSAGCPLMLMHCTSAYPTPYEHVRLGAITELKAEFDVPVGLSDHSLGIYTCLGAVALGASALEKHFTISRNWPGPDVSLSIEPYELAMLVEGSRAVHLARGGKKTILPLEKPVIDFAYATVVSIASIKKGDLFTEANTWVKRPGTGPIHARQLNQIIGKRALTDIKSENHIHPNQIEGFSCTH